MRCQLSADVEAGSRSLSNIQDEMDARGALGVLSRSVSKTGKKAGTSLILKFPSKEEMGERGGGPELFGRSACTIRNHV